METERMALSQRERDRLGVLHEVQQKQISQREAARRLKISDRQVHRLLFRVEEQGDREHYRRVDVRHIRERPVCNSRSARQPRCAIFALIFPVK
jgi:hypothetical protein